MVALTFDDGVSPANCRRILATLVADGVPATFFPITEAMPLDPAFWRLVAAAGYPVGDHTWSHPQLPTLDEAAQEAQISRGRTAAEGILGEPLLRVLRPPYGAYDGATLKAAAGAGFPTIALWDTSDRDTSQAGTVAEMRAAAERGTDGSIVLLHCGPNATPYLLPDVIASYRARGFTFVTIPEILGIAWTPGLTRTVTPEEILGGLAPLPPESKGGPITGPNGYVAPSPSPSASPTSSPSGSTSPSRSPTPPRSPRPSPGAPAASPGPASSSPPSVGTPVPGSAPPGGGAPSGDAAGGPGLATSLIFGGAMLALVLTAVLAVAATRRR